MKRVLVIFLSVVCFWPIGSANAGPKEEYEEAYNLYIAAGASIAAYNGRVGELANLYLEQSGWTIDHYVQLPGHTGARFLLAKMDLGLRKNAYVLAIVGTESIGDIKMDLKVDKIYFAGSSIEECAANAAKKNVSGKEPKVHRGFNEFTQAGLAAKARDASHYSSFLPELLKGNRDCKLYITGHSLGGAAATLVAARLISMGVNPGQIEVITFGAPAVGNAAFAAQFGQKLHLTRVTISGDPVTRVLQPLGGYKQFGREIKWNRADAVDDPHKMIGYVDKAIKNYYDKRQLAANARIELPKPAAKRMINSERVYIVPVANKLSSALSKEFWYMREVLWDEYRKRFPGCVIETEAMVDNWREKAAISGCRWVIVPEISSIHIKQEESTYHITLNQTVYDVTTGAIVDTAAFSTGTNNLTPLEAFIHDLKVVTTNRGPWSVKAK
ncbi:MAG: lipase class 3 [Firmicutes bacterium]|nr:lipase class 3 [Bacillota bacterium]